MTRQLNPHLLKQWFMEQQRDLPWRRNRTPYAVWISEMMLQQTQVSVVIPYFERWLERFPSIQHLAEATLDEVIKVWEGLGYYSRARYLHEGARYIMQHHRGVFPDKPEDMEKIKGLGPYTLGAIRSFAFQHKVPAVDGNVLRVLSRYFCIEDDLAKSKTVQHIRNLAEEILPEKESWIFNEALIELGATICTRNPNCQKCPLKKQCLGYLQGKAQDLPYKSKKTKIEQLYRTVAVIKWNNRILVRRGQKGEIMSDLHEFPYFQTTKDGIDSGELQQHIFNTYQLNVELKEALTEVSHSFTHYRVRLTPMLFHCDGTIPNAFDTAHQWLTLKEISQLAFSSGHRKILQGLL